MSTAEELLRAGDLDACLAQLQGEVRKRPDDAKLRVFLSQLLMITGEWDRALNQLSVVGELDAGALPMKHTYSTAIQCEQLRAKIFSGERPPVILGEPPQWIASLQQSLALQGQGRAGEAAAMRAQALEAAPATAGSVNGVPFEWIADADSRLGPVLEVVVNGGYFWAPFERIARIQCEKPTDARDLVWLPAQFTWSNGGEAVGLIPSRYPGSEASGDAAIRLSRKTEWSELAPDTFAGLGQRLLATSADEYGLLEVREVVLGSGGA